MAHDFKEGHMPTLDTLLGRPRKAQSIEEMRAAWGRVLKDAPVREGRNGQG